MPPNGLARSGVRCRSGAGAKAPLTRKLTMKFLSRRHKRFQHPDLFDWAASRDIAAPIIEPGGFPNAAGFPSPPPKP
jgi:hypothetical protein